MAVQLEITVDRATRDQFDELDDRVGQSMAAAGGPPPGLMSHVVHPEGDGFVLVDVWAVEDQGRAYVDEVLRPLMAEVGLEQGRSPCCPSGRSRARAAAAKVAHAGVRGTRTAPLPTPSRVMSRAACSWCDQHA